jgi:hypothetical protein
VVEGYISVVIQGLQGKKILPLSLDLGQIIQRDKTESAKLIVNLHESALNLKTDVTSSMQEISTWLLSLGLLPSIGDEYFPDLRTLTF